MTPGPGPPEEACLLARLDRDPGRASHKVRNAVLMGVADAIEVVETLSRGGDPEGDRAQQLLEERMRLLPAPEERPRRNVKAG